MGKMAFVQSIRPYRGKVYQGVYIFGLDTEFVPRLGQESDMLTWQLASAKCAKVSEKKLNLENLYASAKAMLSREGVSESDVKHLAFITFFSLAEIQFFDLREWAVSEFKGKYKLKTSYMGFQLEVLDLADWYPHKPLKEVAEMWGEKKLDYEIGPKVEAVVRGELSREDILADPRFRDYAVNDAVITQRIFAKMRDYFLETHEVDIIATLTPANTSASIFRKRLDKKIGQGDTDLRELALRCCWGGRMEAFFRGTKPNVKEYDATGHHPNSAIALEVLPLEEHWKRTNSLKEWLRFRGGLGKVSFKFPPSERFPCLPIMHESKTFQALMFPLEGVSFCTLDEAKQAKRMGASLTLLIGFGYNDGSEALSNYLLSLQAQRNASKDPAERQLLKYMSNGVIGKFFQKKVGMDLAKVQAYAIDKGIPFEEAIRLQGQDWGSGNVTVGSCFYPEWYALILGYARSSICEVARRHNALVISSDSFVTEEDLGEEFEAEKISFGKKAEGELICFRTRFYRVGDKLAHHAVHSKKAAEVVLREFKAEGTFAYGYERFLHLRESWRDRKPFGCRIERPNMTVSLGYDYKRRLMEDGTTEPWKRCEDRDVWLEERKIKEEIEGDKEKAGQD